MLHRLMRSAFPMAAVVRGWRDKTLETELPACCFGQLEPRQVGRTKRCAN
jgi:hypothetical protein